MSEQLSFRQRRRPNSKKATIIISDILATSENSDSSSNKKKHFSTARFRGLGCAAAPQVSVPSVIGASASWEQSTNANNTIVGNDRAKKKRLKAKKINVINGGGKNSSFPADNAVASSQSSSLSLSLSSDVWCGPGIGLTTDVSSVDCVVSAPPRQGRPKVDGFETTTTVLGGQRERSYPVRRMVRAEEDIHFLESEAVSAMPRHISQSRYHRHHLRNNHFHDGLSEIMIQRSNRLVDVYGDMRIDVDNMSYEELLELGDRIGYVSTGLGEEEISCCLRRTKLSNFQDSSLSSSLRIHMEAERKCSICQEEYETEDEMGKLHCAHLFHIDCIKHWLSQKNRCPICKTQALSQS